MRLKLKATFKARVDSTPVFHLICNDKHSKEEYLQAEEDLKIFLQKKAEEIFKENPEVSNRSLIEIIWKLDKLNSVLEDGGIDDTEGREAAYLYLKNAYEKLGGKVKVSYGGGG